LDLAQEGRTLPRRFHSEQVSAVGNQPFAELFQGAGRSLRDYGGDIHMAIERNPNDPYRSDDRYRAGDPTRPDLADEDIRRSSRLESDLQADPELAEGPAEGPRIALIAVGIALLLGAVFYGLNNSSVHPNATPTAQKAAPATAQNTTPTPQPASPANPNGNAKPGVTTGAAPSQTPPPAPADPAQNAPKSK
jgi:hypothetical protein